MLSEWAACRHSVRGGGEVGDGGGKVEAVGGYGGWLVVEVHAVY